MATIRGTKGRDVLSGGGQADQIIGAAGHDLISGLSGNDTIYGDDGNDRLLGGGGNDILWGGDGQDGLKGGKGADKLYGEEGNDLLTGGAGGDLLNGGAGIDTASYAGAKSGVTVNLTTKSASGGDASGDQLTSIEAVIGSAYGDVIVGSGGVNVLSGLDGTDTLSGLDGNDVLDGGTGDDELSGGDDDDALIGGAGNDTLLGDAGNDILRPGAGIDIVNGGSGVNTLDYSDAAGGIFLLLETGTTGGAAFGDTFTNIQNIVGSGHNDVITANATGAAGVIDGGGGDDTLIAGSVSGERLIGGYGSDQLIAAAGSADEFELQRDRGADFIFGFDATNAVAGLRDTLVIDGNAFGIGSVLDPSELVSVLDGAGPQFLQQLQGGELMLYFDADGEAGAYGLALVARLNGVTSLTVDSFLVV